MSKQPNPIPQKIDLVNWFQERYNVGVKANPVNNVEKSSG